MSRLEEVESILDGLSPAYTTNLCLSLAAEVDELNTRRMETIAMSDLLAEELAAANATLAALREVVPPHGYWPLDDTEHDNITAKIHAILYTEGRDNG